MLSNKYVVKCFVVLDDPLDLVSQNKNQINLHRTWLIYK